MPLVVVTGGCGFIGCNLVRMLLRDGAPDLRVRVFDAFTYAGDLRNLADVLADDRLEVVQGDVTDAEALRAALEGADQVYHLAAESHNDRAILDPWTTWRANADGAAQLLIAAKDARVGRVLFVSTDEVYGVAAEGQKFSEDAPLNPRGPYQASKAAGDCLARAFFETYGLNVVVARPTNNYGPYQFPEKLIPVLVWRALNDQPLPLYGDGQQRRDFLHVEDCCRALKLLMDRGQAGQAYNIPGDNEHANIEVARAILQLLEKPESLIHFVADRPGHDFRYALDGRKLADLGWQPLIPWEQGLRDTVAWYVENRDWLEYMVAKAQDFLSRWYSERV
ncbi:MAG: dTDP-glucose 4,6-dehydratase [Armatimonadetes bacterium]|nr:dTDP-glucose 4,6-dehydratase [Armatimonadota bacterium]